MAMARGSSTKKRKAKSMEEETATTMNNESISKSTDETNDQLSKASGRSKKVKAPKPTELLPDQRNFADLWKQVFPVGTEWEQLTKLYKYKWDFSNLENAFEEGGELYGQKVYLFGCTEPQFLFLKGEGKVICVPAVVAVVSPFPPSDKIGINSVQREVEEILPMKQMKMDWIPYIPLEDRDSQVERLKSQVFILICTQRRAGLSNLKEERAKKFEYCLPFSIYKPVLREGA